MNKFIEILEAMTGKRVIRPKAYVSHDGTENLGTLRRYADQLKRLKWHGVKRIKGTEKLNILTTNDLDENLKLRPDYLARRKKRKKKNKHQEV